jgi:hypothetical protein
MEYFVPTSPAHSILSLAGSFFPFRLHEEQLPGSFWRGSLLSSFGLALHRTSPPALAADWGCCLPKLMLSHIDSSVVPVDANPGINPWTSGAFKLSFVEGSR